MRARSAEGGGVAVGFLQVRQSLLVQLHGVPGQPALDLPISPLKSAAQKWRYQCHPSRLITHRLVLDVFFSFFFFYTQMHLNTHRCPDYWHFLFVCAPCDSRGCQPLMQDEKHIKKNKTKILQPTVLLFFHAAARVLEAGWMNSMLTISKADVQFPFPGKVIHLSTDNNFRPLARRKRLLQSSAKSLVFQSHSCFSSACFTSSRSVFSSERSFKREKLALHFSFLSTRARKWYIWQCCWWFALTIWLNPEHGRLHSNSRPKKDW